MAEKKVTASAENPADNKNMVEVFIPLDRSNEKNDKFYCSVNGVAMLVPMGKRVEVPAPYAHVIMNAQAELDTIRSKNRAE